MIVFAGKQNKEVSSKLQADLAFSKARSKAFTQELKDLLLRRSKQLLPFDDVKERLELWHGKDIGLKSIPLNAIVGSQGRYHNFTRHFLPLDESLRDRWKQIESALESDKDLPPVELYKVCNAYFVKDGHHRISVAMAKGKVAIEAKVFEYDCDLSLDDKADLEQIAILETYHRFLKETGLKEKKDPGLYLTVLGGYPILMEHIQRHRFYLEKKDQKEITIKEAAWSWFDNIYAPMKNLIDKNGIMEKFPHRTATDFYIWISKYKTMMFQDVFVSDKARNMVENYTKVFSSPLRILIGKIRKFLGLVKY